MTQTVIDYVVNKQEDIAAPKMGKDELYDYCLAKFKVKLDLRKPIDELYKQVEKLEKPAAIKSADKPTHLLNPTTGHWFEYTEALATVEHMKPCDERGKLL